ncbi:TetR/AcrR family transcriptional regulator [Vibrio sp. HN007]|uniref:TetR/AcrR family transcriptional regulator n=1 Tax=Vibrio iocasae TaxID=3098914 RepID=UPI0035D447DB
MTISNVTHMQRRTRGKRSLEESHQTKEQILMSAIQLFCEKGYEVTSIRKISQASMVAHSCISHHFGSKEQLWLDIGDYIYAYMVEEVRALDAYLQKEKCSKKKVYLFSVHVIALLIRYPIPIKYMSEAMRILDHLENPFRGEVGEATKVISPILCRFDEMNSHFGESMLDLKWILISSCYTGANLTLLSGISQRFVKNMEVQHWKLYSKIIADYCELDDSEQMSLEEIDDLILYLSHPLRSTEFSTEC